MPFKMPNLPDNVPQTKGRFTRWLGRFLMKISGWKIAGQFPNEKKFIISVAPHTSNWDFIVGLRLKFALNFHVNFLGKNSLFFWPLGVWLKYLGGIPIYRNAAHGFVGQMVDQFNKKDKLVIVVTPEGTRSKVGKWKTGFLHMAKQAEVPIVPLELDYRTKEIKCHPAQFITGEIEEELKHIQSFYDVDSAKIPQNY